MGTTRDRSGTFIRRVALSATAAVIVHVAHAEANPPSSRPAPCESSLSDRYAPSCRSDAEAPNPDGPSSAEADGPAARDHDDLDDRPIQIETMNQQIRMERRRKETLLHLYPDEATHAAARLRALAETDKPIRAAETRIEDLTRERRRLAEAAGLYAGKRLPPDLWNQLQSVDVALRQAMATLRNSRDEHTLVGKIYDEELVVLRKLWAAPTRDPSVVERGQNAAWKRETASIR